MRTRAAIASGHSKTCEVASEILKAGGNVVDAAIAALSAMFITEPAMASPGAGGFATVHMKGEAPLFFDFFCHTPSHKRPEDELDIRRILVNFGDEQELFYTGNGTTAVPGMLAGMYTMHDRFGSIPISDLFQPSIELMKKGVALDAFQQYDLSLLSEIFLSSAFGKDIFGKSGQLKKEGEIIQMTELADFMEVLSIEGQDLFYKGEAGKECVEIHQARGGLISREDLTGYKVEIRKPLHINFKDVVVQTAPLPFLGGAILHACLRMLEKQAGSKDDIYNKFYSVFKDIVPVEKDPRQLGKIIENGGMLPFSKHNGSTSHFSIVDANGNAISLTTSLGEGSGLFLPGSGIHMNNMLGELALLPGGVNSWVPNVRLNSRMCPTIIRTASGNIISLGTGGAGRIPYVLTQAILHWDKEYPNTNWDDILEYPRVFLDKDTLHVEHPLSESDFSVLDHEIKIWENPSMFFGGINLASSQNGDLFAYADSRRRGHISYV